MSNLLTIGEVARRSGIAASALRFYEERGLLASSGPARVTVATRGRCCGGSRSSSSPSGSGLRWTRSARSSRSCLWSVRRPAATGRVSRARGRRGSTSASPSCERLRARAHRMHRLRLSLARAAAGSRTPATAPPASGRVPASGSATAQRSEKRPRLQRDPVAAQRAAARGVLDHVLELAAVRLDDAGRGDVVLQAGDQHALEAEQAALLERERQDQPAVALALARGTDAVADVAALLDQIGIELVADRWPRR